ncbi:MAG: alpha/beta hydrolase [Actinomycetia bacterium]|nr:alpha/beta hydrolase [Actinomycetes bacterium]
MRKLVGCLTAACLALAACGLDDGVTAQRSESVSLPPTTTAPSGTLADDGVTADSLHGELMSDRCPFEAPSRADAKCYRLVVPIDWSDPVLGDVSVEVAVFAAEQQPPAGSVLWVEGGPGAGPLEGIPGWFNLAFSDIVQTHNVVVYDPRGTGFSRPSLDCPEIDEAFEQGSVSLSDEISLAGECSWRLGLDGVDLQHFGTLSAARDLEALRRSLQVEAWDIWGQSYGTRLAQTYVREFEPNVRSMVLDGAYSIADSPDDDYVTGGEEALRALADLCESQPTCAARFPDLLDRLESLVTSADSEPFDIVFEDPGTGLTDTYTMTGSDILSTFYGALFSHYTAASIPVVLSDLEAGVTWSLGMLSQPADFSRSGDDLGAYLAVQCMDEWAFVEGVASPSGLFADIQMSTHLYWGQMCDELDLDPAPEVENRFAKVDVPTLVMSGPLDPITPASEAAALSNLLDAQHVVFGGTGHGQLGNSECAAALAAEFTRTLDRVAPECASSVAHKLVPEIPGEFAVVRVDHRSGVSIDVELPVGWVGYTPMQFDGIALRDQHLLDMTGLSVDAYPRSDDVPDVDSALDRVANEVFDATIRSLRETGSLTAGGRQWTLFAGSIDSSPISVPMETRVTVAAADIDGTLVVISVFGRPDDHDQLAAAIITKAADTAGSVG